MSNPEKLIPPIDILFKLFKPFNPSISKILPHMLLQRLDDKSKVSKRENKSEQFCIFQTVGKDTNIVISIHIADVGKF